MRDPSRSVTRAAHGAQHQQTKDPVCPGLERRRGPHSRMRFRQAIGRISSTPPPGTPPDTFLPGERRVLRPGASRGKGIAGESRRPSPSWSTGRFPWTETWIDSVPGVRRVPGPSSPGHPEGSTGPCLRDWPLASELRDVGRRRAPRRLPGEIVPERSIPLGSSAALYYHGPGNCSLRMNSGARAFNPQESAITVPETASGGKPVSGCPGTVGQVSLRSLKVRIATSALLLRAPAGDGESCRTGLLACRWEAAPFGRRSEPPLRASRPGGPGTPGQRWMESPTVRVSEIAASNDRPPGYVRDVEGEKNG
jgi:hypothetical protein